MNMTRTLLIAVFALFLTTGIAGAADLDDLDVSIHVVGQDDDINEMGNELKLPDSVSESAREHADDATHNDMEQGDDHAESTQDGQENETEMNDSTSQDSPDISTETSPVEQPDTSDTEEH
jgi:hypothetical protein